MTGAAVVGAVAAVAGAAAVGGMAWSGPYGWQRARGGLGYRVGGVEHVLPELTYAKHTPCLLRPEVLAEMRRVLAYAHGLFTQEGIAHWLTIGSLLGAYRHAGFVPWDDDIDLQVPLAHRERIEALRPQMARDGFRLLRAAGGYKLAAGNRWRYPFVDVIMVAERAGKMALAYPLDRAGRPTWRKAAQWPRECFPVEKIFPLDAIAFEGLRLPVPRAGRALVDELFGRDGMTTVRHRRWARWHNHLFMMTAFRLGLSGG
jgi:LicD family